MYVYVMGRGHSGSTILDVLLGNAAAIQSVGELVSGVANPHHVCSCGATLADCPFWSRVRAVVETAGMDYWALARATRVQAHVGRLAAVALARPGANPDLDQLARSTTVLADAIREVTGKPHVLDSGKEPTRALFLLKFVPEARIIHLVRDPQGVLASHYRRITNGEEVRFLRRRYRAKRLVPLFLLLEAMTWTVGNLICEAIALTAPDRVLRVRYEELRDRPVETVTRLGTELGVSLDGVAERLARDEGFAVGHNLGGNDIRLEGVVRFDQRRERRYGASPGWISAVLLLCWPLMPRYGYQLRLPFSSRG
jgi:Sulfotransferase family